ncbi:uncharacterized protein PHALS_02552 [Plasmopara halstedii]|uniref:Uncharacterized protein n=1 Tax=Plasmopara halstedii TaxID=4781 RepID=A0A0P1AXH0_PLAHL|nr:uncharacterized protein PHALS_02552 [Plasmopara halstedii]CEG46132.1 hypothetical protein PHALS_02552 [Plasmopara halstedii]|eukprot:XP_024582501.1 hypothetical protein PHALS_02552 [Plasmopara halstedii]
MEVDRTDPYYMFNILVVIFLTARLIVSSLPCTSLAWECNQVRTSRKGIAGNLLGVAKHRLIIPCMCTDDTAR